MKTVFVGFTTEVVKNIDELMTLPQAPSNYKDPDKIRAYIETALVRQRENAQDELLTGRLADVCFMNRTGTEMPVERGESFLAFVDRFDVIIGHRIHDFLNFAIANYIETEDGTEPLPEIFRWAKISRLTNQSVFTADSSGRLNCRMILDPVELMGGHLASSNPLLLCRRWRLPIRQLESAKDFAQLSLLTGMKFV